MGRRSRKSKRRVNSLFMMMLLSGILLIMSTYAWFSANKQVQVNLFRAKVSAAEGLQISLDAVKWGSSVNISDLLDTNELAHTVNAYTFPDELVPVSTDGTVTSGNFTFKYGDIDSTGSTLSNVGTVDLASDGKLIAFDCYFKNSSSQATDEFQLESGSVIKIGTDDTNTAAIDETGTSGTGLEFSTRMGLVLYENTAILSAQASDVRGLLPGNNAKGFIWEPGSASHINEVVVNDATRIPASNTVFRTLGLTSSAGTTITGVNAATVGTGVTALAEQPSIQTATGHNATSTLDTTFTMITTASALETNTANQVKLTLAGNAIMKTRIYIWLEGQDPDCIDTASTGKWLDVLLKFTKPNVTP